MKKFSKIKTQDPLSNDINTLDNKIQKDSLGDILEGPWEIDEIMGVSLECPQNESLIINAELGGKDIKRGDFIYITALIRRKGSSPIHHSQMGVIKSRVVDIYNSLMVLNSLKK